MGQPLLLAWVLRAELKGPGKVGDRENERQGVLPEGPRWESKGRDMGEDMVKEEKGERRGVTG